MRTLTLTIDDVNTVRAIEELARKVNKQMDELLNRVQRAAIGQFKRSV